MNNPEFIIRIVKHNADIKSNYISQKLRNDKEFIKSILKETNTMPFVLPEILNKDKL